MSSGKGESLKKKNPVFFFLLTSESDICRQDDEVRMESGQTPSLRGVQCRGRGAHRVAAAAALSSQRKWRIRDGLVRI